MEAQGFFTRKETESKSRPDGKTYSCISCGRLKKCNSPKMEYSGNFERKILNIGMMPSKGEDRSGMPFKSKPYRMLEKAYNDLGIDLHEDCANVYALKCYSEDEETKYQIDCCKRFLLKLIDELKPKIIVAFGDVPLQSLIGNRWKKDFGNIIKWRGWTIPDQDFGAWIVPTFAPENVIDYKNPAYKLIWKQDLQKVSELDKRDFPKYKEPEIIYLKDDLTIFDSITTGDIAFDYETTGLKPHGKGHTIFCASVAVSGSKVYSFMMPKSRKDARPFIELLERDSVRKIAQNIKFEDTWTDVRLRAKVKNWIWDTMQATHIIDNRSGITSLKFQTYVQFGIIDYDSEINGYLRAVDGTANGVNTVHKLLKTEAGKKDLLKYCAYDSIYEFRLAKYQRKFMTRTQGLTEISPIKSDFPNAYKLMHDGILALAKAERQGLRVDVEYCERQKHKLTKKIERIEKKIFDSKFYRHWQHSTRGNVNLNSGTQLGNFLYNVKKLEPKKLTAGGLGKGSTDEDALKMLKIEELDWIIERSKMLKIRDTYLDGFIKEQIKDTLHTFFNLHIAKTYRSSSQNPNFQNMPTRDEATMRIVRGAVFPRKGNQLLEMDYSGIEVGIAACYHKDRTMIEYLENDFDMHGDMAAQIFMIDDFDTANKDHSFVRKATKNGFVFPEFYGDYFKNCAVYLAQEWMQLPQGRWKNGMGVKFEGAHISDHLISKGIKEFGIMKKVGNKTVTTGFIKHLKEIEENFWEERFPEYAEWKEKHYKQYLKDGYVSLKTGFVCKGVMGKNDAINYPIQGAAFHCLLWTFTEVTKELEKRKAKTRLVGQIHDAVVVDVAPDELLEVYSIIQDIGTRKLKEHFKWINVPIKIDAELCAVDESWATKEKWEPVESDDDIPF